QKEGQLVFEQRQRSQLVSVDISDAARPQILQRFDIEGQLREGVARKIGDVVYVVSYVPSSYGWGWNPPPATQKDTAWVYSYNVADASAIRQGEALQLFEGGAIHESSNDGYRDKSFSGVTIAATPTSLMVVENWYVSDYAYTPRSGCGSYD